MTPTFTQALKKCKDASLISGLNVLRKDMYRCVDDAIRKETYKDAFLISLRNAWRIVKKHVDALWILFTKSAMKNKDMYSTFQP